MQKYFTYLFLMSFIFLISCPKKINKGWSLKDDAGKMVLRAIHGAEASTLDPTLRGGTPGTNLLINVFEGLLRVDNKTGSHLPGVAEKWEISKDGKKYTFHLRQCQWTNGEAITSEDFVFTFRRAVNPKTNSRNASLLFVIKNAEEVYAGKKKPQELGIKAIDKKTLEIELKNPASYFLNMLTMVPFYPVPKAVVEKHGSHWTRVENIVSNGPFKVESRRLNDKTSVVKNPLYWGAKDVKLDKIIFFTSDDTNTTLRLYQANEVDFHTRKIAPNAYPKIKDHPEWVGAPFLGVYYYMINCTKPPLNNPKFRKALSIALNRKLLTDKVIRVGYIPAYNFIPPDTDGYKPGVLVKEDVAEAKKLLKEAGFDDPSKIRPLTILYNTSERHKQIALVLRSLLKDNLGIQIKIENAEWKTYLDRRRKKEYDIARAGWIGDFNDPYTFLELLYSQSVNNETGWKSKKYDEYYAKAQKALTAKEKLSLEQKAEAIMLEEAPFIVMFFYIADTLVKPYVKDFYPATKEHVKKGYFDIISRSVFRNTYIDLEEKKKYLQKH